MNGVIARIKVSAEGIERNGHAAFTGISTATPEGIYEALHPAYPKFYKMDRLCKWAFVAAELLSSTAGFQDILDKTSVAVVLMTNNGCIVADRLFQQSQPPSPALFVYTLPNIMLGELAIRHGFKGEQLCLLSETYDRGLLLDTAGDLIDQHGMTHCLAGWIDVSERQHDIDFYWIGRND